MDQQTLMNALNYVSAVARQSARDGETKPGWECSDLQAVSDAVYYETLYEKQLSKCTVSRTKANCAIIKQWDDLQKTP